MDGLFDLLASLLVVQSRIPLAAFAMRAHCWLVVGLLFPWTNKVVLRRAAFQMVGPQCVLVRGVIPPQAQVLALSLSEYHGVSLPTSL